MEIIVGGLYCDWVCFLKRDEAGLGFRSKGVGFVIFYAKIVCSDWWCLVVFAMVFELLGLLLLDLYLLATVGFMS